MRLNSRMCLSFLLTAVMVSQPTLMPLAQAPALRAAGEPASPTTRRADGDPKRAVAQVLNPVQVVTVSAASFEAAAIAPEAIVAAFGTSLATTSQGASSVPLPTSLANTTVKVKDSAGNERLASLFFVSPFQINFQVPSDAETGPATVTVTSGDGTISQGTIQVQRAAPALFTANADGGGVPTANLVRVKANGDQIYESLIQPDPATGRLIPKPIDLGPEGETVVLVLYGTGLRRAPDPNNDGNLEEKVRLLIGGVAVPVGYAGPQGSFVGLDQVNVVIPRTLIGSGRVSLSVSVAEYSTSNLTEIEIAGTAGAAPPVINGFSVSSVLAGQTLAIQGSGFAPNAADNLVRIGGVEATVNEASATQLSVTVPYGAGSGTVLVRTPQGEAVSGIALSVRTSVSGVVEDTANQPLSGVAVRLVGITISATTNSEGVFLLPDAPAGPALIEIDGGGALPPSLYPKLRLRMNVSARRDNQFAQPIALHPSSGAVILVGSSGVIGQAQSSFSPNTPESQEAVPVRAQTGGVTLEVPSGAAANFGDGTGSGDLTLSVLEGSRTPTALPSGQFSSTLAQITPFGASITPGGKLIFPNTEGLPVGSQAKLFRLNQYANNDRLGSFVEAGTAAVSADGQRIETAPNAITETGIYFVSVTRQTTTVMGRVVEGDGSVPVRRVLVRSRGQVAVTDGSGSFILRNVPVRAGDQLTLGVGYLRPAGRVERLQRGDFAVVVNGVTFLTPEIRLPSRTANRAPAIFAPGSLNVVAGKTLDTSFLARDPDSQAIQVSVSGAAFASVISHGNDAYTLRLAPGTAAVGPHTLMLAATDTQNARTALTVAVNVLPPAPAIADFNPKSGAVGTTVAITGTGLKSSAGETTVTFAGNGALRLNALVISASASEVKAVVPNGTLTGSIQLNTASGRATSPGSFTVTASQDFALTASPSAVTTPQGSAATYVATVTSPLANFTQLVSLSVTGAPAGVKQMFDPAQITAGASSTLTLMLPGTLAPGTYSLTLSAKAIIDGGEQTRTATATLNVQAAGQTVLTGRVLNTNKEPVIGATISLDGKSAATDASGAFLLSGVTAGKGRPVMVDGRTASAPNRTYPVIAEPADIEAGKVNEVPFIFYLPPVDTQHEVTVMPNQDTMVMTPMVKEVMMMIPAGANLRNRDGSPVTRASITPVDIDRTPAPLPSNISTPIVFTSQPGGAVSNMEMPVVYPNLSGLDPNTRVPLYNFNHDTVQWYVYGYGRVSADGRTIVPETNPATGKPYGLRDFSWHGPGQGPIGPCASGTNCNPAPPDSCPLNRGRTTVDYASGMKIETTTDLAFGGVRGRLELTRIYTSDLARAGRLGRFGRGTRDNFSIRLIGTFQKDGTGRLAMPEEDNGRLFSFVRTDADGALVFATTATISQLGDVIRKLTNGTFEYRMVNGMVYRFDARGRLIAMVDNNGNTTTLAYTGNNLTRITDPVGRSINLEYNSDNFVTRAADPLGRVWAYNYDTRFRDRLLSVTDPLRFTTKYEYGDLAQLTSVTDKRGLVVKLITYDNNGRVTQQKFADSGIERYEYTFSGTIVTGVTITDPLGRKMSKRLSPAGYVIGETDELGQSSTIARDITTQLPFETVGPCGCPETKRQFDVRGNVVTSTDRLGQTTRYEYEPVFNNLTRTTDRLGRVTAYVYDSHGNRVSMTNALGQVTTYTYDQFGQMTSITDALGHTTRMGYDAEGNLLAVTDALGNKTTREYDEVGRLKAILDPLGRRTALAYDALDRVLSQTDPSGATTRLVYDANGNQVSLTNALDRQWMKIYDVKNRLTSQIDPLRRLTRMTYDLADQMTSMISPSGRTVRYTYDARGQRASITDGLGGIIRFTYDNRRNLKTLNDQRGNTTTFSYDELFRLISQTDPLGHTTNFEHDAEGNVIATADRLGRRTNIGYDALNRRERVAYVDAVVNYAYDLAGRLTRIDDTQGGPIEWSYDDANRRKEEKTDTGIVKYSYNEASQRASMTVADRPSVTYDYDSAGRLRTIKQGAETFTYAYDPISRLASLQRPNGVKTEHQYDAVNRLMKMTHTNAAGVVLEDFRYSYNADDEIASIISLASGTAITTPRNATVADAANRVTQFGQASYSFDSEGQATTKTDPQGTTTYTWDARGRLMRATLPNGQTVSYGYDALGRRVSRTASGATTNFLYDGADIVLDRSSSGGTVDYLTDLSGLQSIDKKLRQTTTAAANLYFLQDHQGSTTALTDAVGSVVERMQYEAFGENGGSALTRYGYTGRERDSATGLLYYRARWYDPQQGRFIQSDPVGFLGGLNLYAYVQNNPINFIDPDGRSAVPIALLLLIAIEWAAYCHEKAFREVQSAFPRNGKWTDKNEHCFVSCSFNRCMLLLAPNLTLLGGILWELTHRGYGLADALRDIRADIYGILGAYSFESCKDVCVDCPGGGIATPNSPPILNPDLTPDLLPRAPIFPPFFFR